MTILARASALLGALLLALVPAAVTLAATTPEMATDALADAATSPEVNSRTNVAEKSYSVAGAISIVGSTTYSISNSARTVNMTAEKIRNNSGTWLSGSLRLRLFVTTAPISGGFTYWTVGELALDQLQPLYAYNNLNQTVALTTPPDGVYYVHLGIFEYEASCTSASGYCMDDYVSFSTRVQVVNGSFSAYTPPVQPPLTIQNGVWWSPTESGSGYAVHVSNGVLVMQIYSYRPDGEPQWYLTAGRARQRQSQLHRHARQVSRRPVHLLRLPGTDPGRQRRRDFHPVRHRFERDREAAGRSHDQHRAVPLLTVGRLTIPAEPVLAGHAVPVAVHLRVRAVVDEPGRLVAGAHLRTVSPSVAAEFFRRAR